MNENPVTRTPQGEKEKQGGDIMTPRLHRQKRQVCQHMRPEGREEILPIPAYAAERQARGKIPKAKSPRAGQVYRGKQGR
jgi:hypothetical protein